MRAHRMLAQWPCESSLRRSVFKRLIPDGKPEAGHGHGHSHGHGPPAENHGQPKPARGLPSLARARLGSTMAMATAMDIAMALGARTARVIVA